MKGDVLPRLLGFFLLLFLLSCVFDPADQVLSLKVYIFLLCWGIALTVWLSSREQIGVPRGLLIYTLLFILIPWFSILWYWLTDSSDRFEGFALLKGYLLITLAPMLVLGRIDLLPRLCAVLTVLAVAVIAIFIALVLVPELFAVLYLIGTRTGIVLVSNRSYGVGVDLLQVYFVTSPMLAISIAYYFDRAHASRGRKALFLWALVVINALGMLLAGTRNNMLVSILLPAALVFYYARNKALGALLSLTAVAALVVVFSNQLAAFFDPSEVSNSVKLAMLDDYAAILDDPVTLLFGRGLGAFEYWEGRGFKHVTELTYLELVRNFGLFGAVLMLGLLLFPIWHAFATDRSRTSKAIAIGFASYLGMCASNPNMFSSMGILILSVMLSAIFLPDRGRPSLNLNGALLASSNLARTMAARN